MSLYKPILHYNSAVAALAVSNSLFLSQPMSKLSVEKILQSQGFGSRKYCRQLVLDGEFAVAGAVLEQPGELIETEGLVYEIFDESWEYHEKLYLALNKPENFECSRKPSHHPGILTLLPEQFSWRDVQPVGRLDHDTTGLILLSDDGAFIHALSSPKRHVPKRYLATTAEPVSASLIKELLRGVKLHDEPAPIAALICEQVGEFQLELVIEQGKYHQVKRMLAAAGNHCAALQRIEVGGLKLTQLDLELGQWCYLTPQHLDALWDKT